MAHGETTVVVGIRVPDEVKDFFRLSSAINSTAITQEVSSVLYRHIEGLGDDMPPDLLYAKKRAVDEIRRRRASVE